MAHDVFISYSHKDKAVADAVCAHFEQNGLRCWYAPRDIEPGEDWADSIVKAIDSARVMALIFTDSSNISQQVLREVSSACRSGAVVIPFRLTEAEPVDGMLYYLSTVHWLDAMNEDLSDAIHELYKLCSGIVRRQDSPEPRPSDAPPTPAFPSKPKKLSGRLTAVLCCAAALIVIGAVLAFILGSGALDDQKTASPTQALVKATVADSTAEPLYIDYTDPDAPTEVFNLGAVTTGLSSDPDETYSKGNLQSNMQNKGYLAGDGEWYYYRSNDDGKMYRMRPDGSGNTLLTDLAADHIAVIGDHIYYAGKGFGITRMDKDGTHKTVLEEYCPDDMVIIGDRIYYTSSYDGLSLYSVGVDGSDNRKENSISSAYHLTSDGNYIYFAHGDFKNHLFRAKPDGSGMECILDHGTADITIAGKYLYYTDYDDFGYWSYDLSSGEKKKLFDDQITDPVVAGGKIYGHSTNTASGIICLDTASGEYSVILKNDSYYPHSHISVCGLKLVFYNDSDDTVYMMNTDGSGLTKLP